LIQPIKLQIKIQKEKITLLTD